MNSSSTEEYCREKAAVAGTSFYYCTLFYPADIKRSLNALHAFHAEIGQVIEDCTDPGVAHLKLAWWHEEIQRLYTDTARHPVTRELTPLISRFAITATAFFDLIRHYEQWIHPPRHDSFQDITDDMAQGPGKLWKLSTVICGFSDQDTPEIVSQMGSLFGLYNLIQNHRVNRLLPPNQQMDYLKRLIIDLDDCCRRLPEIDCQAQAGALILANIIKQTCNEITRDSLTLDQCRVSLTPLRKLWIAWRTHKKVLSAK
jgi:phytoene synthase